jgi:hypothetical protein
VTIAEQVAIVYTHRDRACVELTSAGMRWHAVQLRTLPSLLASGAPQSWMTRLGAASLEAANAGHLVAAGACIAVEAIMCLLLSDLIQERVAAEGLATARVLQLDGRAR